MIDSALGELMIEDSRRCRSDQTDAHPIKRAVPLMIVFNDDLLFQQQSTTVPDDDRKLSYSSSYLG
jgi:hypothetical protein